MGLILNFDRGAFQGFEWYDFGPCTSCGGSACISTQYNADYQRYPQSSCAREELGDMRCLAHLPASGPAGWCSLEADMRCLPTTCL